MTFGMTLAEYLMKAASTNMFYFAIDYENEPNMKMAASNVKHAGCFLKAGFLVSAWPLHSGKPYEDLTRTGSWTTCRLYLW